MAEKTVDWRLFLAIYALTAAAFAVRAQYNVGTVPLLADTDDAMRLVVVRDLLSGQGWYDAVQHRLNTPFGAEMHWSRLADLPLAGLIQLLSPIVGDGAETAAAFVLPLLLLLPLLWLCARLAATLAGREAVLAALVLPPFALSVSSEFAPGRVDHHGLQILLLLAMTWLSVEALARPRFAAWAGIAAATSMALGVEGLPSVAAAILAFGLMWVASPERAATMRIFGISFAAATLAHLAIALPPERWLVPACDAISLTYAATALGVGVAFAALSMLPLEEAPPWRRAAIGVGAGGVLMLVLFLAFPACLGGPYAALDPWLKENWLSRITEAASLVDHIRAEPAYSLAVTVPLLVALGATCLRVWRGKPDGRGEWLVYAVFLGLAAVTMLVQVRASRMATPLAVPACAWLIVVARRHYLGRRTASRAALLALAWIASAGIAVGLPAVLAINALQADAQGPAVTANLDDERKCLMPEAFAALAAMPRERVMAPIDLGSHLLAFTPHEVVAAPYHRNEDGVRDALNFFNRPIEDGRAILDKRGVSLVVICPALPELASREDAIADSFVSLFRSGTLPEWLLDISPEGTPLKILGVKVP